MFKLRARGVGVWSGEHVVFQLFAGDDSRWSGSSIDAAAAFAMLAHSPQETNMKVADVLGRLADEPPPRVVLSLRSRR